MSPATGGSTTHLHNLSLPQPLQTHHQTLQPIQPQPNSSSASHSTSSMSQQAGMYSSYGTHNNHNLNGHGHGLSSSPAVSNVGIGHSLQSSDQNQGPPTGSGLRHLQNQSHGNSQSDIGNLSENNGGQQHQEPPQRSRNARAQARHRAKRKAYIEQLEDSVARLQAVLQLTPEQAAALQLPTAVSTSIVPPSPHGPGTHPSQLHSNVHPLVSPPSFSAFNPQDGKLGPVFSPGSTGAGGNNGVGVNQTQVLFLRLRLMVEEYSTLRNYAIQLYKATEELGRSQQQKDRGNGVSGEGAFWDGMDRIRRLGTVPTLPQPLESLVAMPDLQIHTGQVSGVGTMGLGMDIIGESGSPGSGVKRRRRSSELHGESALEDGDRREDVSSVYLTPNGTPPLSNNAVDNNYSNNHNINSTTNSSSSGGHGNRALPPPLALPLSSSTMRPPSGHSGHSGSSPVGYNGNLGHSTSLPSAQTVFASPSPPLMQQQNYLNHPSPKRGHVGLGQEEDAFPGIAQMPPPMPRPWFGNMSSFGVGGNSGNTGSGTGTGIGTGLNVGAGSGSIGTGIQLPPPVPFVGGPGAYLARLQQQQQQQTQSAFARNLNAIGSLGSVVPKREEGNEENAGGYGHHQHGHGHGESMNGASPTSAVDVSPVMGNFTDSGTGSTSQNHVHSHGHGHSHSQPQIHSQQNPASAHGRHSSVNVDGNGNGTGTGIGGGSASLASPISPYSPVGYGSGSGNSPFRNSSSHGGYADSGHGQGQSHQQQQQGMPSPSPVGYTPQAQTFQSQQNQNHDGQAQGVYTSTSSSSTSMNGTWSQHTSANVIRGMDNRFS